MCPNCVLNQASLIAWIGPGLICLTFGILAAYFWHLAKKSGEFEGNEEDAKYAVFDD